MTHVVTDKKKLLNRVHRLRGQIEALEKALDQDADCPEVMQLIAASRGALDGLMGAVVEDHVRHHMLDPDRSPRSSEARAAEQLIDVIKTYLR